MDAFPPDRRRHDLDNLQKLPLDALQDAGVYEDDSQIDLLIAHRREPVAKGRIDIYVDQMPLLRCPLCSATLNPEDN